MLCGSEVSTERQAFNDSLLIDPFFPTPLFFLEGRECEPSSRVYLIPNPALTDR